MLKKILEFLIGFVLLPRILDFFWIFLVALLNLGATGAILLNIVLSIGVLIVLFYFRKIIALGFLLGSFTWIMLLVFKVIPF